ncbi:MAG: hypothetical protein HFI60_18965 [Lachnospiraceae bacterium]|nr:hypothetical protein [Lachnospiraceae bacterium]
MARKKSYDYFWNSNSDRYYDADSMGDWLRPFFANGIFNGQMQVTANDNMSVTIAAGYGYINGKHRHFLTPTTLDLEVASGTLNRIDAVMLRRDDTQRMIYLLIVKGGNAATPIAPQPTRDGAIYELKLADIYIAAGTVKITQAEIADTRMNSAVCGWVAATVKQIDFTQIQAQFDAYFAAYKKNISDQYQEYIANIQEFKDQAQEQYDLMVQAFNTYADQQKEIYETWIREQETDFEEWSDGQQLSFAQWRQNQEQAFNNWYLNNTGAWTNDFLKWFDGIKGILGTDSAGALQNEIEILQNILYSGKVPANLVTAEGDELITSDGDQLIAFWTLKTSETCNC